MIFFHVHNYILSLIVDDGCISEQEDTKLQTHPTKTSNDQNSNDNES